MGKNKIYSFQFSFRNCGWVGQKKKLKIQIQFFDVGGKLQLWKTRTIGQMKNKTKYPAGQDCQFPF